MIERQFILAKDKTLTKNKTQNEQMTMNINIICEHDVQWLRFLVRSCSLNKHLYNTFVIFNHMLG